MTAKMLIFIVVALIIILVVTFLILRIPSLDIGAQASESEKLRTLDKWLESVYEVDKFNGTVLLSKKGKIIFLKSYGNDGVDSLNPLTEHSSFNLASVSKQFTAMGIVMLNSKSKVKYHDKVSTYIPELVYYKDITIQQLLHHTSGLPDYMQLSGKYGRKNDIFTTSEMLSLYQMHHPSLKFKPGSKFEYSNAGYVFLAEIIERVSGVSFQSFMTSNIFKPLNMKDTRVFNILSNDELDNRVYGYKHKFGLFGGKKSSQDLNHFDGVVGDGGIYSSAHDLNLWHKALKKGSLVSSDLYHSAYVPAQLKDGSKTKYGFGWFINDDNSAEHAGGWQGFSSYIYRNMEKDELIVILDNSSNTLRVNSIGFRFNSIGLNLKYFLITL